MIITDLLNKHVKISDKMANELKLAVHNVFDHARKHYNMFIGLDFETNGLEPLQNFPLLLALGHKDCKVCIDCTRNDLNDLFPDDWQSFTFIGHNIKFDATFLKLHYNMLLKKVFCTMVANFKLNQNLTGNRLDLVSTHRTFCKGEYIEFRKDIRKTFIGANPADFVPNSDQIEYALNDIAYLYDIMLAQVEAAKRLGLLNWLINVEMPTIISLVKAECRGIPYNFSGAKEYYDKNKEEEHKIAVRMDEIILQKADELYPLQKDGTRDNRYYLIVGGKYTRDRAFMPVPQQYDLFGNPLPVNTVVSHSRSRNKSTTKLVQLKTNIGNINYNSDQQIIETFARLEVELPTEDDMFLIPVLSKANTVKGKQKSRIKDSQGFSREAKMVVACGAFVTNKIRVGDMLLKMPDHPMKEFLELLLKYRNLSHNTGTFGESMLGKVLDGRVYTQFTMTRAVNGRLASGNVNKDKTSIRFNAQNQPRDNNYRTKFIASIGRIVSTNDLSGAEVTILCNMAQDEYFYNIAVVKDDAHSPLITKSWRAIFAYRAGVRAGAWNNYAGFRRYYRRSFITKWRQSDDAVLRDLAEKAEKFTVSKTENPAYRQGGKNNTFGSIYGMEPPKAADSYNGTTAELRKIDPKAPPVNVTIEEAKVALHEIKTEIPKTFEYVDNNVFKALHDGYLILSERSQSRVWFKPVLEAKMYMAEIISGYKERGIECFLEKIDTHNGVYTMNTGDEITLKRDDLASITGQARNIPISGCQADMIKECMVTIDRFTEANNVPCDLMFAVHDELVYDIVEDDKIYIMNLPNGKKIEIEGSANIPNKIMAFVCSLYLPLYPMKVDTTNALTWKK